MSEYQYYEFLAIDRPLDDGEQAAVRSLSTRARITATSFVNEYHWGDFRGNPNLLMERYYDAHLQVTNWGTHRVMFRLPSDLLGPDVVEQYCAGDALSAWVAGELIVLDFTSQDHNGEFDFDYDAEALLSASSAFVPNSPRVISGHSTSRGWPPTAPGNATSTSSTATPTTTSNHPSRPGSARSPRHSEH